MLSYAVGQPQCSVNQASMTENNPHSLILLVLGDIVCCSFTFHHAVFPTVSGKEKREAITFKMKLKIKGIK